MPKHQMRGRYSIVIAKDGSYGVEVKHRNDAALTISGFRTEEEARAWIEGQEGNDALVKGKTEPRG